jgi:hypothetical protein
VDRHRITVTVSVRPEVLAAAKHQVAQGNAASLSAWVEEAMIEKADRGELVSLLTAIRPEALDRQTAGSPLPRRSGVPVSRPQVV